MSLNDYANQCHAANMKWWQDPVTGAPLERNKGELLCLIHSEISECMEGERKNLPDNKLPHRRMQIERLVLGDPRISVGSAALADLLPPTGDGG